MFLRERKKESFFLTSECFYFSAISTHFIMCKHTGNLTLLLLLWTWEGKPRRTEKQNNVYNVHTSDFQTWNVVHWCRMCEYSRDWPLAYGGDHRATLKKTLCQNWSVWLRWWNKIYLKDNDDSVADSFCSCVLVWVGCEWMTKRLVVQIPAVVRQDSEWLMATTWTTAAAATTIINTLYILTGKPLSATQVIKSMTH